MLKREYSNLTHSDFYLKLVDFVTSINLKYSLLRDSRSQLVVSRRFFGQLVRYELLDSLSCPVYLVSSFIDPYTPVFSGHDFIGKYNQEKYLL